MFAKLLNVLLSVALFSGALSATPASASIDPASQTSAGWQFLPAPDTLDLYLNGQYAGACIRYFTVHAKERIISLETHLTIGDGAATAQGMISIERRDYGFDGSLKSADQELASKEGRSTWRLGKDASGAWHLTATAGGIDHVQAVPAISENLGSTVTVYRGIRNRTLRIGEVFPDSSFDLMSARTMVEEARCIEAPAAANGGCWKFVNTLQALGRAETLKIDTAGATIEEGMFPFVAKRAGTGRQKTSSAPLTNIVASLSVPASRPAGEHELIALTLDASQGPDSSVLPFYLRRDKAWVLSGVPATCRAGGGGNEGDRFTTATLTMQSDNAKIKKLADSLVLGCADRCDSINACYRYVWTTLEKRYSSTFSNAIETLDAGYGDCGEHSVLLAALLRATHIGARVVLGLVYAQGQKGYAYHAWVMVWSHGAWVFVDSTLGVFPAPRDRVPLVLDDDGSHVIAIGKVLGAIRIGYVERER